MARYRLNVEVGPDGSCMAHVVELPGCITMGATREEAVAAAPKAIARHLAWLRQHAEAVAEGEDVEVEVQETVPVGGRFPGAPADQVAFFASDREPVSEEEIERALRWAEHCRRDLLHLFEDVSREALDWRLDDTSWTIRRILEHIASAEAFYVTRLDPHADREPLSVLGVLREAASRRLRELSAEQRAATRTPRGEPWSARKVLRRFLEHEQEHLAQLRQLLEGYRQS